MWFKIVVACIPAAIVGILFDDKIDELFYNYQTVALALIIVGILMAQQLKGIEWDNLVYAASGFMTVIFMILAYSISNGIAIGFITYTVSMIGVGKIKEIKPIVWILDICFVIFLVFLPK